MSGDASKIATEFALARERWAATEADLHNEIDRLRRRIAELEREIEEVKENAIDYVDMDSLLESMAEAYYAH